MQLSIYLYAPNFSTELFRHIYGFDDGTKPDKNPQRKIALVGSSGLEPPTSRLSGVCSNQLSYEPIMVEVSGFEPLTPCLQGRCSTS